MKTANLTISTDERVDPKFAAYPEEIRSKLSDLRDLIIECATEVESIKALEETLKWGEPSFLVKKGSTIRIDWKAKTPEQYAIYFKCTSKLVPTFKEVFGNVFNYEKNRAILFDLNDDIPKNELKACIKSALTYHSIKNEPFLGMIN